MNFRIIFLQIQGAFVFCSNEYINATKINGSEPMGRQWIVTQGPLNTTIEVKSNCYCYFSNQFLFKLKIANKFG